MKIALFTPLNPVKSGIADYNEELLPELAKHFDIHLYIDKGYQPIMSGIKTQFPVFTFDKKTFQPEQYEEIVYHIGNSYAPHRYIFEACQEFPGIVVLHDYLLQGYYAEKYFVDKDFQTYAKLEEKYYGEKGVRIARHIADRLPDPIWDCEEGIDYPLNEEIISRSRALIVHSDFVKRKVAEYWDIPIETIRHHQYQQKKFSTSLIRKELEVAPDEILLVSAGFINRNKRLHISIPAVYALNMPKVKYLVVGKDGANLLHSIVDKNKNNIIIKGYVPLEKLQGYINAADICINLRYPTMGESSGSQLRMMSCAKPVLVTNCHGYTDFPDYTVLKIDADIDEQETVEHCLRELIRDSDFRLSLGREALLYVESECHITQCARNYAQSIKKFHTLTPHLPRQPKNSVDIQP